MSANNNDPAINLYLREIGRIPLLSPQEEIELAGKVKSGDSEARLRMINSNLRLVVTIARDYTNIGLPLLDLVSEGNIGLMTAVDRFDPSKGARLSTYAGWWIRQAIKSALSNQSKTIRLPSELAKKISKMRSVVFQMSGELGREPTDEELGDEIGIASERLSQLKAVATSPASLDASISEDDITEFGEGLEDQEAQTPFELLRDKDLYNKVGCLLEGLDHREKEIISQRFGFGREDRETLEEVGKKLGVSRERIRQLENSALSKLRRMLTRGQSERNSRCGPEQASVAAF